MRVQTEMVIRMEEGGSEKGHAKAMKVAAATPGVESVTLSGKGKSLLRVVGDGVDCNHLTTRLRRKVGHADVVELRTLHSAYSGGSRTGGSLSRDAGYGNGESHYYGYAYPTTTTTTAAAAPDYYYHYGQQPSSQYYSYQPPPYAAPAAAVHYEYYPAAATDPNGCSIM